MSNNLSKKYKEYRYIHYYSGIELDVICVSTSIKKFAEYFNSSQTTIGKYTHIMKPRTKECIENPDILYAQIGLGGEGRMVFKDIGVITLEEYKIKIDEHRKKFKTYRDFLEKKSNEKG